MLRDEQVRQRNGGRTDAATYDVCSTDLTSTVVERTAPFGSCIVARFCRRRAVARVRCRRDFIAQEAQVSNEEQGNGEEQTWSPRANHQQMRRTRAAWNICRLHFQMNVVRVCVRVALAISERSDIKARLQATDSLVLSQSASGPASWRKEFI